VPGKAPPPGYQTGIPLFRPGKTAALLDIVKAARYITK
jgi:hypothetical protein